MSENSQPSELESTFPTLGRRAAIGGVAAAAGSLAVLVGGQTASATGGGQARAADEAAIRQLSIDYALGTDAIAIGDFETGRRLYDGAFSENAPISAGFDPSAAALRAEGPEAWANVVIGAFTSYTATQHLLGTINVVFDADQRNRAQMTSYLQATHVLADAPELLIVSGTYIDTVERQRNREWRITERFLQFLSFSTTPRTLP